MRPPYRSDASIEREANYVLRKFASEYNGEIFPLPLEDMCEILYGLFVESANLAELFNREGILGAFCIEDDAIYIDSSLDPNNTRTQGRYRFTLAHEIGHQVLHRDFLLKNENNETFAFYKQKRTYLCRERNYEPLEVQANKFASYLLMPKEEVLKAWERRFGPDAGQKDVSKEIEAKKANPKLKYTYVCNHARDLAREFEVSGEAMQNRLVGMKLISLEPILQGSLF